MTRHCALSRTAWCRIAVRHGVSWMAWCSEAPVSTCRTPRRA
jgi:hypothetical protein